MKYLFAAALLLFVRIASAGDINLTIENVPGNEGDLRVALYKRASFMSDTERVAGLVEPAKAGVMHVTLSKIPAGDYAIGVFHDANGNGKLDKNLFGVPTEAYGFSRDARGTLGPPSFDDARLQVGEATLPLVIHLK